MSWHFDPQSIGTIANCITALTLLAIAVFGLKVRSSQDKPSSVLSPATRTSTVPEQGSTDLLEDAQGTGEQKTGTSKSSTMQIEKYYDFLRGNIIHLDNMVDRRMMWLLTAHGFLFGAFGFSDSESCRGRFQSPYSRCQGGSASPVALVYGCSYFDGNLYRNPRGSKAGWCQQSCE